MLQHHIQLKPGDCGRYVLLPGDPARSELIAGYFDEPAFAARNREYTSYTGSLLGEKVSVVSTGIGCPSAAIAVEELCAIGCDTFIRVGTSGSIQDGTRTGDLAIVTAAIRDEGTSRQYLPLSFPAVAHTDVVNALRMAGKAAGARCLVGVSHSKDAFYAEVDRERLPLRRTLAEEWEAWKAGGAICSEMEAAAIFVVSSIRSARAGGIMLMYGDEPAGEGLVDHAGLMDLLVRTAIEGIKALIRMDRGETTLPV